MDEVLTPGWMHVQAMLTDGRLLDPAALLPLDEMQHTMLTCWIHAWLGAGRTDAHIEGGCSS